jgi:lipopolysaccharide assembly outer membrane protein LptD (OstA)
LSAPLSSLMTCANSTRALIALALLALASSNATAFDSHQPFDVSADMIDYLDANQEITAEGHVNIVQSSSSLTADYVQLDRVRKRLIARGNVIIREKGGILAGDFLDYDLVTERGV